MKLSIVQGTTSYSASVFIQDTASTTGDGLTGLVFNSGGLTAYYARPRAAAVVVPLVFVALTGAYTEGGFIEIDAINMPGWYRLDLPDGALAAGADSVGFHLEGAANMAPLPLEIQIIDPPLISIGSGGISLSSQSFTGTTVGPITGTFADTFTLNGILHTVEDSAGSTEFFYETNVGPNGVPQSATWTGYAQSKGDSYTVEFFNWQTSTWDEVGTIDGDNGTVLRTQTFDAKVGYQGTGADSGTVRLKFLSANGTVIATDRLLFTFSVVGADLGYEGASVWVDEGAGPSTGTLRGIDGLVTWRSDDFDNAQTIATDIGYTQIGLTNGNTVTLTQAINNFIIGVPFSNWTLDLGGQDVTNCDITAAHVSGIALGSLTTYRNCEFGATTIRPGSVLFNVAFSDTITLGAAGDYQVFEAKSSIADGAEPVLDMNSVLGLTTVNIRGLKGGLTVNNLTADHSLTITGDELGIITLNGADAFVRVGGVAENVVNNLTGSPSVSTAGVVIASTTAYPEGVIFLDTVGGTAGSVLNTNGRTGNQALTIADAKILADALGTPRIRVASGSDVSLTEALDGYILEGEDWALQTAGFSIDGTHIHGADVATTANSVYLGTPVFHNCEFPLFNIEGPGADFHDCDFGNMVVDATASGSQRMYGCNYGGDFLATTGLDFNGAAGADSRFEVYGASGAIQVFNATNAAAYVIVEGQCGVVLQASCTAGFASFIGGVTVTDGSVTMTVDITRLTASAAAVAQTNATLGVVPIKNVALPDVSISMYLSSDHATPATGLTPTLTVSIDGGAFVPKNAGTTIVELGATGIYSLDLAAPDTNGTAVDYLLTDPTADDSVLTIRFT